MSFGAGFTRRQRFFDGALDAAGGALADAAATDGLEALVVGAGAAAMLAVGAALGIGGGALATSVAVIVGAGWRDGHRYPRATYA